MGKSKAKKYPGLTSSENRLAKMWYAKVQGKEERLCVCLWSEWIVLEWGPKRSAKKSYDVYHVKDVMTGEEHSVDTRIGSVRMFRPVVLRHF